MAAISDPADAPLRSRVKGGVQVEGDENDRQTDGYTDRQTDRQTRTQTEI